MESILQFMYFGEGKFYYERMGEFIKVAKDLEVHEIDKDLLLRKLLKMVKRRTLMKMMYQLKHRR